jgi:carboxylate-amine ligase
MTSSPAHEPPPSAEELRATFDAPAPFTVGLEEEVMLLDPATLELAPRAEEALALLEGDPRFKLELPASQLEIVTVPHPSVPAAMAELRAGRVRLAERLGGVVRPACAGVHPFSPEEGALNAGPRYDRTLREYAGIARRQLVCALQVHVAVGGAERTLGVYNALRSHLPELAALAANAPFHAGRDTGLASVRPILGQGLPRQGVPPPIASWEDLAAALDWGARAGAVPEPGVWWWELRPHHRHGTLELRVPDAQSTLAEAGAVAAVGHCLVAWLAERHDAGELAAPDPTWRIEENRWSACRHGVEGEMADLRTGGRVATRVRLHALLDALEPVGEGLGCAAELARARDLAERNGALRRRDAARRGGLREVAAELVGAFLDDAR